MKKILSATLAIMLALGLFAPMELMASAITVTVNGRAIHFSYGSPIIVDGQALVPVEIFEHLGFEVSVSTIFFSRMGARTFANVENESHSIVIQEQSEYIFIDDQEIPLSVPARTLAGSFYLVVPLRAVLDNIDGYSIRWEASTQTITITTQIQRPTRPHVGNNGLVASTFAAGWRHTAFIMADGAIMAMGDDASRQAEGPRGPNRPIPDDDVFYVTAVAAANNSTMAIIDGVTHIWGDTAFNWNA